MKFIKIKNKNDFKKALLNMNKLSSSAVKGWNREKALMKEFESEILSKAERKKLEKIISQNYRNDDLKIEQRKELEKFFRKK